MKVFQSGQELIDYCAEHHNADLDGVLWFVCIQEAKMVSGAFTLKDIAYLFKEGIKAYEDNPLEAIDQYVQTQISDLMGGVEEGEATIVNGEISDDDVERYAVPDLVEAITAHFNE